MYECLLGNAEPQAQKARLWQETVAGTQVNTHRSLMGKTEASIGQWCWWMFISATSRAEACIHSSWDLEGRLESAWIRQIPLPGCGPLAPLRFTHMLETSKPYQRPPETTDGCTNGSLTVPTCGTTQTEIRSLTAPGDALKNLGQTIHKLREQKALTQEQLAHGCASTAENIARLEPGELGLTLTASVCLAEQLGTAMESLLEGI